MLLGSWFKESVEEYKKEFASKNYVVIDEFFDPHFAKTLAEEFPDVTADDGKWHEYKNPLEIKHSRTDIQGLQNIQKAFEYLESLECIQKIEELVGIEDLQRDPFRHGAGLHCHTRGGKLDMHVDYSIHPILGKTRCLNLIVYVTPDWNSQEWGGHLHLNDQRIAAEFNRAVIFRTDGPREAVHGMPYPVTCPADVSRKSLAIYYLKNGDPLHGHIRFKANFFPMHGTQERVANENLKYARLFEIRSRRRLEEADLWEGWEIDPIGKNVWWT